MRTSDNVKIYYYDKETGFGILSDGSYFWYSFWWEDKKNDSPPLENCIYVDYKNEDDLQFRKFLDNYVKSTLFNFTFVDIT